MDSIVTGEPKGYTVQKSTILKAGGTTKLARMHSKQKDEIEFELETMQAENAFLKARVAQLEAKLVEFQSKGSPRNVINSARMADVMINGDSAATRSTSISAEAPASSWDCDIITVIIIRINRSILVIRLYPPFSLSAKLQFIRSVLFLLQLLSLL